MKLSGGKAAADFLAGPDKPFSAALIYGPDAGLIRERTQQIIHKLVPDAANPFSYQELSDEDLKSDPARLADECASLSLTGERRVVYMRNAADRHTKLIEACLPSLGPQCYLLATAEELGPRSSLRLLFEQQKQLAALPCYHDEGADLHTLIQAHLQRHRLAADRDAISYIAAHAGNDRAVTVSELEKLALYAADQSKITLEDVMRLMNDNSQNDIDDVASAVADRNAVIVTQKLSILLRDGTQPIAILRMAQKYFQRLYQLAVSMENGKTLDQAVAELRPPVFFRQQPVLKQQARFWNRARAARALQVLGEAELACKSGGIAPGLICSQALTRISSKASA